MIKYNFFILFNLRATVKNLSNKRLRPPRHIDEDTGVIQPYSYRKAKGSAMLIVSFIYFLISIQYFVAFFLL